MSQSKLPEGSDGCLTPEQTSAGGVRHPSDPGAVRVGSDTCLTPNEKMICERCGKAEMYRMHAVWRCPDCGFKTDCCGW
jgi:predicted RNA-binding Zn-ribbon protein involved in translation (DUF1610 family)